MRKLLKNRIVQVVGVIVLAIPIILSLTWTYEQETYASIKDCGANPPFEGVYWGMTIPEFCEAMGVEESDLVKGEPIPYDEWNGIGSLKRMEEELGKTAEEIPLYEHYENQFDLQLTEEIFGTTDYHLGDKKQTIRVVFTDEIAYNGKTIPPLLCFILCEVPHEQYRDVANAQSLYYFGEELESNAANATKHGYLNNATTHWMAYKYSRMLSSGVSMEKIQAYDMKNMNRTQILSIPCPDYPLLSGTTISIEEKVDDLGWTRQFDEETVYIVMKAGSLAYYEWFLNELT